MGKLLEVLGCTLGGPSFLPSNIPQHHLQTSRELIPVANQWQSVGNSRALTVS